MQSEVNPQLEGVALLGKGVTLAGRRALYGEGVILRVGQIAYPQVDVQRPEVGIGVGAEYRIEVLADGVLLIPVGLTLRREVESHRDTAQMETI